LTGKRIGILTGGGDVAPLNAVINAAITRAAETKCEIIGFLNGWAGVLGEKYVDLTGKFVDPAIGGTILRSSRVNLAAIANSAHIVREKFSKLHLDGLIIIGGDDTLSNAFLLPDFPQALISKTIDNDVGCFDENNIVNYFTLGYPTAAEKIASFVSLSEGVRTTAYSHERIVIVESMGMHAGWLAISSSMGHPDFIVVPEFPLDYQNFKERVKDRYLQNKNVVAVIAEGSRWKNGDHISADEHEKDSFGHPKFKGAAEVLAQKLKMDLKQSFDTRNVNHINPSYLYRSGRPNETDVRAARLLGKDAVELLVDGLDKPGFITLDKNETGLITKLVYLDSFATIEGFHRFVGPSLYDNEQYFITDCARQYLTGVIGEMKNITYGIY
jgi:6-phosphofructokinase